MARVTTILEQIPEASAARVRGPRVPRFRRSRDIQFPIALEIVEASSDARRAEILLRLPDALLIERTEAITHACRQAGFKMGLLFIHQRVAALSAVRGRDGQLPEAHRQVLELWTSGMAALAAGER